MIAHTCASAAHFTQAGGPTTIDVGRVSATGYNGRVSETVTMQLTHTLMPQLPKIPHSATLCTPSVGVSESDLVSNTALTPTHARRSTRLTDNMGERETVHPTRVKLVHSRHVLDRDDTHHFPPHSHIHSCHSLFPHLSSIFGEKFGDFR